MWHKWRDKIRTLFIGDPLEDIDEAEPKHEEIEQGKTDIHAKMIYQYPKNSSFRFPVIKDDEPKNKSIETPAFQRKANYNEVQSEREKPKKEEAHQLKDKKETRKKFTPSRVPSPIYGYHKRDSKKQVEDIPAFMRKDDIKFDNLTETTGNEEEVSKNYSLIETNENCTETIQKKTNLKDTSIRPSKVKKKETEMISETRSDHQEIHTRQEKREKQQEKKSDVASPFNVIMTPRDKKNLMDNKKRQQADQHVADNEIPKKEEDYCVPYYLLDDPVESSHEDRLWVKSQQELLEQTLMHFNVQAKVVNATQGPSVTRFEVQPEFGVKVSKVRNLSDDIKLNMAAKDIRIEAPIPGKNTIGIEIPNLESQMVGLQEILQTNAFQSSQSPLTIGLGLTVEGTPLITNISKMPHGLIAGATGSGKSVCINTILISLLYKSSHNDVKFLLVDPKMVELAPYNGIPHLVAPVITDVKAATLALNWAVEEMEERYEKFVRESVRDIDRYNEKMLNQGRVNEKMPYMVIVIDELADLMMISPHEVEEAICRIAQKARACGMHLLLATQRPSVDVITGLIKANIPTRIAFSVSSQVDSRTIIDTNGADRLLGKGDMLFIENGSRKNIRLQGAYVSDEEIERVTNHVRTIAPTNYLFEQEELLTHIETDESEDELFNEVLEFIIDQESASTSLLQRHFRIGYNRAARLIDSLENRGIISGQNGSKPRELLLSKSQIEENL